MENRNDIPPDDLIGILRAVKISTIIYLIATLYCAYYLHQTFLLILFPVFLMFHEFLSSVIKYMRYLGKIDEIKRNIDLMKINQENNFTNIATNFEIIQNRFDTNDRQFGFIEKRNDNFDKRFDIIEKKQDETDKKIPALEYEFVKMGLEEKDAVERLNSSLEEINTYFRSK